LDFLSFSPEARKALPWLAWFEGGVFERYFLMFSELAEEDWARIRPELEATALLRVVELNFQINDRPFLELHPTLQDAVRAEGLQGDDGDEVEGRMIAVYLKVGATVNQALHGNQPAAGMALMAREEGNLRRALARCFRDGRHSDGWSLASTLCLYLERAARYRERDVRLPGWGSGCPRTGWTGLPAKPSGDTLGACLPKARGRRHWIGSRTCCGG
jgi:hypothetical protein